MLPPWLDQTRSTHSVICCSVSMRAHFSVNCSSCAVTAFVCWRMQVRFFQSSKCFLEEFEVDLGKITKCSHSYYFSPTSKNYIVLLHARISWRIEIYQDKVPEILRHLLYLSFLKSYRYNLILWGCSYFVAFVTIYKYEQACIRYYI